jgi:hypothetical protein
MARSCTAFAMAVATGMILLGCGALGVSKITIKLGDATVEITSNPDGTKTFDVGGLPPNKCYKVTFLDKHGNSVGFAMVNGNGTYQAPVGTEDWRQEEVNCNQSSNAPLGTGSLAASPQLLPKTVEVSGGPALLNLIDGGAFKNAVYHFRVHNPGASAWDDILPILMGGPGTPVPGNVEVLYYSQTIPEPLGARVRLADTEPFAKFRFDWNGVIGYADLSTGQNVVTYGAGNGWNVVETFVPTLDFLPLGAENEAVTTSRTQSELTDMTASAKIALLP